jgi:hypothetical protein
VATTLTIDTLIETAKRLGGHRTNREVVTEALTEYIQRRNRLAALKSLVTIDFDPEFDYKQARTRR